MAEKERWWRATKNRARDYAEESKKKVHIRGKKTGQELSEREKGKRQGYFECLSDQAGHYRYNYAKQAGATEEEAVAYSRIIGKGGEDIIEKAKKRKKSA